MDRSMSPEELHGYLTTSGLRESGLTIRGWVDLIERVGWKEHLHPRASDGKFGSGGASPSSKPSLASKVPSGWKSGGGKPSAGSKSTSTSGKSSSPTTTSKPATGKKPASPAPAKDKAWQDTHYAEWKQRLTPAQSRAIAAYKGADYEVMNAQLRSMGKNGVKDPKFSDEELARAGRQNRALIDAIRKAPPTTEPMTVHRTMTAKMAAGLKPGSTVGDKGFVSASLAPKKTSKGATVSIDLPEGTKAAVGADGEMILPSSGKFRVVSVEDGPNGQPHVRMEFVPHGSKPKTAAADPAPKAAKAPAKTAPDTKPAEPKTAKASGKPAEPKSADSKASPKPDTSPEAPPRTSTEEPRRSMRDATRHLTHQDGVDWLDEKMASPKKKPFTAADRAAVKRYTGDTYELINDALRNPNNDRDPKIQSYIDGLDGAMTKSTIPEDVIVHRGVGNAYVQRLGADGRNPASMRSLIGKVATEDAYVSTSAGGKAAFDDKPIQLMVRVPKGHRAVSAMPISKYPDERELLLDRGTSWVVHDVYEVNGKWHMEVEVVPTGWQPDADWRPDPAGDAAAGYAPGAEWGMPSPGSAANAPTGSVDSSPASSVDSGGTLAAPSSAAYDDYRAYLDSGYSSYDEYVNAEGQ